MARVSHYGVLILLLASSLGRANAQQDSSGRCDNAWLAGDWQSVATACGAAAFIEAHRAQELVQGTPTPREINAGAMTLGLGALYGAREAVAYLKLGQPALYETIRKASMTALSTSVIQLRSYGSPEDVARLSTLLDLVQSPGFPDVAATSPTLAPQDKLVTATVLADGCAALFDAAKNDMYGMSVDAAPWLKAAECYFIGKNWTQAISIYKQIGLNLGGDPDAYVMQYWHLGVAYAAIGRMHDARTALMQAYIEYDVDRTGDQEVSPSVAAGMLRDYVRLGAKRSQEAANTAYFKDFMQRQSKANHAYAQSFTGDERQLVQNRGIPCHIESYEGSGGYHTETFWYCDASGNYDEGYTFTNGRLTSDFTP